MPSKPTSTAKKPQAARAESESQDLQHLVRAKDSAVASGDPRRAEEASKKLAAAALFRVARLRSLVGADSQALELYRKSLALQDSTQVRLEMSGAALRAGQPDEAVAQTSIVVAANPANERAWSLNAKSWMAKNDYAAAVEPLNHALALRKDPNTQYALAVSYLNLGQKEKAESIFRQMLVDYGDRAVWHLVFAGAYRETKMFRDAVREFKRAIAMEPNTPSAHLYLGATLLEENSWARTDESMAELREAVRQAPRNFYGNLYLGIGESQLNLFAESNRHLHIAAEYDPNVSEIWLYLGLNAFQQQDYSNAKTYLLKAVELSDKNPGQASLEIRRAYIALGRIEFMAGNTDKAKEYAEKTRKLKSEAMAQQAEAIAEMAGGMGSAPAVMPKMKLPEQNVLTQAAPVDPTAQIDSALAGTTLSETEKEKVKATERELRQLLSRCYNDWGTADARQGLFAVALDHFHEAEQWDNATPGLMRNIGLAALKLGDPVEAARALRIAVQLDPSDVPSRARLAMALFTTDQYKEAAEQFGIIGDPIYGDQAMNYAWGYSLVRIGRNEKKAVEVLNHLVEHPLSPDTLLSVGDLYAVTEDYEHAVACYKRALELDPGIARAHYKMGASLIRLSRMPEAISELQTALRTSPKDVDVRYNLAYALLENSQKEPALKILRELVADSPENALANYLLGKTLLEMGELAEAVPYLEVAAKLEPDTDFVHYQLQLAYRRSGRIEDADREAKIYKGIKTRKRESVVIPMPERKQ